MGLPVILAVLGLASSATAAPVTPHNPDGLVAALQAAGYQAKLSKTDDGSPEITSAAGGNNILIAFSGCDKGANCDYLEFIATWDCSADVKKCDDMQAQWSKEEHVGTIMKSASQVAMYHYLVVGGGNVSDDTFINTFEYFARDANEFEKLYK